MKARGSIQRRRSTTSCSIRAICAAGPPKDSSPIRAHSATAWAKVGRGPGGSTSSTAGGLRCPGMALAPRPAGPGVEGVIHTQTPEEQFVIVVEGQRQTGGQGVQAIFDKGLVQALAPAVA